MRLTDAFLTLFISCGVVEQEHDNDDDGPVIAATEPGFAVVSDHSVGLQARRPRSRGGEFKIYNQGHCLAFLGSGFFAAGGAMPEGQWFVAP